MAISNVTKLCNAVNNGILDAELCSKPLPVNSGASSRGIKLSPDLPPALEMIFREKRRRIGGDNNSNNPSTSAEKLPDLAVSAPDSIRGIKLSPDLSAAAFRQKLTLELITWHQLRYLNVSGSGKIALTKAIEGLTQTFGYCEKTAARHILRTEGVFLSISGYEPRTTIKIYGLFQVSQYLNTFLTDKHWRVVTPDHFNSLGKAKAQLYASIYKPRGIIANPTSRQTLTERTGLHKVQQRRYEKEARVRRTPCYAFYKDNGPLGMWNYEPEKQEIFTKKSGSRQIDKRSGNIYHTKQTAGARGMLRKVNARLKRSSIPDEAPCLTKRFFSSFKKMLRTLTRRTTNNREGYYLINSGYRKVEGRLEWCHYAS